MDCRSQDGGGSVEFSKLKIELYDLAAIVIPGFFLIVEIWALFARMPLSCAALKDASAIEFTVLLICSFAAGNLVQEASNWMVTRVNVPRYFKQARDKYWNLPEGELVRAKMFKESNLNIVSVDIAFDYCLTRIAGKFAKRDMFLAISDFARSLWLLSIITLVPLGRAILYTYGTLPRIWLTVEGVLLVSAVNYLSWTRMMRFRELSETPVFSAYLASYSSPTAKPDNEAEGEPD
jgi:hypothetical protein